MLNTDVSKGFLKGILAALHIHQSQKETNMKELPAVIDGDSRNFKEESKLLKYVHIRSQHDANLATTIGYLYDRKLKVVYYEVARCSHGDKFCKRIGREIAKGRYAKYGPGYTLLHVNSDADMYEQFEILWHPDMHTTFTLEGEAA